MHHTAENPHCRHVALSVCNGAALSRQIGPASQRLALWVHQVALYTPRVTCVVWCALLAVKKQRHLSCLLDDKQTAMTKWMVCNLNHGMTHCMSQQQKIYSLCRAEGQTSCERQMLEHALPCVMQAPSWSCGLQPASSPPQTRIP